MRERAWENKRGREKCQDKIIDTTKLYKLLYLADVAYYHFRSSCSSPFGLWTDFLKYNLVDPPFLLWLTSIILNMVNDISCRKVQIFRPFYINIYHLQMYVFHPQILCMDNIFVQVNLPFWIFSACFSSFPVISPIFRKTSSMVVKLIKVSFEGNKIKTNWFKWSLP